MLYLLANDATNGTIPLENVEKPYSNIVEAKI